MKITTLIMIAAYVQVSANVYSQKINVKEKNIKLEKLLEIFEKQSGYSFFYKVEELGSVSVNEISLRNATIQQALQEVRKSKSFSYSIIENTVVLKAEKTTSATVVSRPPKAFIGRVTDEKNQAMAGVSIRIKGTDLSTYTNGTGEFAIVVPDPVDQVMVFSFIGYATQEISIKKLNNPVQIQMKVVTNDLDQVQVLAYSTTSRRNNTGSTYTIKGEELMKSPVPNVLQMIQNKVPGLFVVQNTGQPGGSFNVQVRGQNGLANVDPLYIVDGVPYPAGGTNGDPQGRPGALPMIGGINLGTPVNRGGNALNYLNPADIESIDVLKDADATSIYGSRGAYGVILITTKKAKSGKPSLGLNLNTGIVVRGTFPEMLNTADYLMLRREALKNDGMSPTANDVDVNGTYPEDRYTNWQEELTGRSASVTRLNANYSGGNGQTNFLIGANYNNQKDIQSAKGSNKDYGFRMNVNSQSMDQKLSLNFSGMYNSTVNDMVPYDFTGDDGIRRAPNAPSLYLPDGNLNWETGRNPAAARNLIYSGVTNNLLGSTTLSYKPVDGLSINAVLGYNLLSGKEFRATPTNYYPPTTTTASVDANSILNNYNIRTWSVDPNIRYEHKFGKLGTISATLGGTLQDKLFNATTITGSNFASDALLYNPATAPNNNKTSSYSSFINRYLGGFGILSYNWDSKYFVNLNGRYDGSTKFGEGHRFGAFGSVALAYIFTKEKWVVENLPWLSFGKIRGSYGTAGGDGINNYQFLARYVLNGDYAGKPALTPANLANADLHWEKNKKRDLGISLGFLKDRILLDVNYYKNSTSDQLVQQPLSTVTGFPNIILNSPALIENTGYEFSLTSHILRNADFGWTLNANMTIPKSKLVAYPSNVPLSNANYIVGESLSLIKLYKYAGVDPQTGLYNFINAAGVKGSFIFLVDPTTLDFNTDRTEFVDLTPKFFGSVSNTLRYKKISLDFTFSVQDRMGLSYMGSQTRLAGVMDQNVTKAYLDRWQKPGDVTDVPRPVANALRNAFSQNNFRSSTGAYERALYARLQNLSISYGFSDTFLKRAHIRNLNVVLQGQNLLTISKYGDLDPENMTLGAMPPLRVFNLGLNLTL